MLLLLLAIAQPADRTRTVDAAEALAIEAGDTVLVRASVPVDEAGGELEARATGLRRSSGIALVPWIDVLEAKPGAVVVLYGIAVAPGREPGAARFEATIEVRDRDGTSMGKRTVAHEITVAKPTPAVEEIALDREAYLDRQQRAAKARELLRELKDELPMDRFSRPPELSKVSESVLPELREFLRHRLRAEAARRRLIAAARAEDPAIELAALRALGSLSKGPSGAAKKAAAVEGLTTEAGLELAKKALADLRLDEAEGMVLKLRNGGRLQKRELALALELLGAIRVARGDDAGSKLLFGQALCADPGLPSILGQRAFAEAFAAAKAKNPCRGPIRIERVTAARERGDEGLVYRITAIFSDDPFGLAEGGDLEIWGTGSGQFAKDRVRSTEKNGEKLLIGTIADNGKMESYAGQILVKVFLRDVSGVVLDSFGDPDPVSLPLEGGSSASTGVPWWVWVLAAGVAVAGAATATALVLTRDDEPRLGIGPIDVTF